VVVLLRWTGPYFNFLVVAPAGVRRCTGGRSLELGSGIRDRLELQGRICSGQAGPFAIKQAMRAFRDPD